MKIWQSFLKVASDCDLTFNEAKCLYSTQSDKLLSYQITKNCLKPDPDRVETLLALPALTSNKEQQHIVGLFAYDAQWTPQYSDKIKPLIQNCTFPLADEAMPII